MAILVKHGQNATAAAYGAYGGGQGARHSQDSGRALALINQNENRRVRGNMHSSSLRARSRELDKSREFQLERDEAGRDFSLDQRENDRMDRRDNFEWEYSAKQRMDFDKLTDSYENAVKSGDYNEDELEEIRDQVMSKQLGIEPLPRLRKKSPWPQGQGVGQTWQSKDGKFLLSRDQKGDIKKLADTNGQPTMKDISSLYQQASNILGGLDGVADPKAIEAYVDGAIKLQQKYANPSPGDEEAPEVEGEPERNADLERVEQLEADAELWSGGPMNAYNRIEAAKEKEKRQSRVVRRRRLHDGSIVNVKQLSDGRWVEVESE